MGHEDSVAPHARSATQLLAEHGTLPPALAELQSSRPFREPGESAGSSRFAIRPVEGEHPISARDWYGLSAREEDVLIGLWKGQTEGEIASDLALGIPTVRQYKKRLQYKVGAIRPSEILGATIRGLPHLAPSH